MTAEPPRLSRQQALRLVEGAYLAAATGLIWLALYYLPVGGALFRLALPRGPEKPRARALRLCAPHTAPVGETRYTQGRGNSRSFRTGDFAVPATVTA